MAEKFDNLKDLHQLVRKFNKIDDNTGDSTYGICSDFIIKLTDLFFAIINKHPLSTHNFPNCYATKKENFTIIYE